MAREAVPGEELLVTLHAVADAVAEALSGLEDWGLAGTREGQYRSDLVADRAALAVIESAGLGALSEESGLHHPERPVIVVLDPVDGSTNASRGLPWWATSACAVDEEGPLAAVVVNHATRTRFEAARGAGARRDGKAVSPTACRSMQEAIVAIAGYPQHHFGWYQYRALGASALDLCAVAAGDLDGFVDCSWHSLAPWDYLGGALICEEAGAAVAEAFGRELVLREPGPRRVPVAASTPELLEQALDARRRIGPPPGKGA